jgi:pyruvate/2-oxoglutarate dehydrogenase complex dihydrolipoamide dehydrogenase (E3) component
MILHESPDVVIIATGATARLPDLEGMAQHCIVSAWEVLQGHATNPGQVVLVIDEEYGHQGPTTAEFLRDRGHEVDLITSQEVIGSFLGATTRPPLLTRCFKKGIQFFYHLRAEALQDQHLIARNEWTGELSQVGPYDAFVYAYGGVAVETLSAPLQAAGLEVRVVGDAFAPRSLQHAILEGHQYARDL